jgi:RNA recognition motif-containing protein
MRLRVSSIDRSVTKEKLQELFEEFGEVVALKLFRSVTDPSTHALGFVDMKRESNALAAMQALNGEILGETPLKVEVSSDHFRTSAPAAPRPVIDDDDDDEEEGGMASNDEDDLDDLDDEDENGIKEVPLDEVDDEI